LVLKDTARGKDISVRVRRPLGPTSPRPLIVFSHGWGADSDQYNEWTEYWASKGYVVLMPTHVDSLFAHIGKEFESKGLGGAVDALKDIKGMQQIIGKSGVQESTLENSPVNSQFAHATLGTPKFIQRSNDIKFLLDQLDDIEAKCGFTINREKIGAAGHSLGSMTTHLLGGSKIIDPFQEGNPTVSNAESRIKCTVVLSPLGYIEYTSDTPRKHIIFWDPLAWDDYKVPMFAITGTLDDLLIPPGKDYSWRLDCYEKDIAADIARYKLVLNGADHSLGMPLPLLLMAPPRNLAFEHVINVLTLFFFDAYLHGDDEARKLLSQPVSLNNIMEFAAKLKS